MEPRVGKQHSKPAGASPFGAAQGKTDQTFSSANGRGEARRYNKLDTPESPTKTRAQVMGERDWLVYGLLYDASNLGKPTLRLLRKGDVDLVLSHEDVATLAGAGITFDNEHHQFSVNSKPVLMEGQTFKVSWVIKANGRVPVAFVRAAAWSEMEAGKLNANFQMTEAGRKFLDEIATLAIERGMTTTTQAGALVADVLGCPAPDFKGSIGEAREMLAFWLEHNPAPIAKPEPATTQPLALPATAASGVVKVENAPVVENEVSEAEFLTEETKQQAAAVLDNVPAPMSPFRDDAKRRRFWAKVNPAMADAGLNSNIQKDRNVIYIALGVSEYVGKVEHPSYMYTGDIETAIERSLEMIKVVGEAKAIAERKEPPVTTPAKPSPTEVTVEPNTTETAITIVEPSRLATGATLFPVKTEWEMMRDFAAAAIKSGLLPPSVKTVEAALYIIETGRELGLPPSVALRKISIIQGQPTLASELMLAMVKARGNRTGELEQIDIVKDETPGKESCTVTMKRKGEAAYTTTFTIEHARKLGKGDQPQYKSQPATMCKWRAVSDACRTVFPDYTLGVYGAEELDDNQE